jgi:outer membrane lipoprotein carrier protein
MFMRGLLASFLIAVFSSCAWADGLKSLEKFVSIVQSGRAEFTQTVTSPAKEGQAARVKTSSGSFEFARPNRFKFVYRKPFEQTIVGDGQTLWLFDVDLNQVTARKQADVLGSTPAALIASASDLQALQTHFSLQAAPDRDGLQWVQATPKVRDGALQSIRLGFADGALKVLEMTDNFAQRSVLTFKAMELNPKLGADAFVFTPPKGADVVRP